MILCYVHNDWRDSVTVLSRRLVTRSSKPRNRPAFRQIQMHLEIATPEWLKTPNEEFFQLQVFLLLFF